METVTAEIPGCRQNLCTQMGTKLLKIPAFVHPIHNLQILNPWKKRGKFRKIFHNKYEQKQPKIPEF